MEKAAAQNTAIVATPMGGTHLEPNSPENILALVQTSIPVSIATDSSSPLSRGRMATAQRKCLTGT
jgi:hypothetical protein